MVWFYVILSYTPADELLKKLTFNSSTIYSYNFVCIFFTQWVFVILHINRHMESFQSVQVLVALDLNGSKELYILSGTTKK